MNEQELIKEFCQKEIKCGCYDARINGIPLYAMVRRGFRAKVLEQVGISCGAIKSKMNRGAALKSFFISVWHLVKILCWRRRYPIVFYSFARVDRINGLYMDKFTDPLITQGKLKDGYLILDHGRAGVHPKPRIHQNHLFYWDVFHAISVVYGMLYIKHFIADHRAELDHMLDATEKATGMTIDRAAISRDVVQVYMRCRLMEWLFKRIDAKYVIGPARHPIMHVAAHKTGAVVMELQHGITYGETLLYSGYREPMIVPDYFLAFGDNKPLDVYGIDESRIVNIGWALQDYIEQLPSQHSYREKDVLVISDPDITDTVLDVIKQLAEMYPESKFHVRPHPHEVITAEHVKLIDSIPNVCLQDNHINITEVMSGFNYVVGENSTVLYEALSVGKRVGKLFFPGLHPVYLEVTDSECFWELHSPKDFGKFLNDRASAKRLRSIYSPFNAMLFNKLIGRDTNGC